MDKRIETVNETDSLGLAIDYFAEINDRNFLPVVNSSNRIQGYLCRARVFSQILKLKQVAWHTKVHAPSSE
ncbi:MAG: hypothetical protein AB8G05_19895 [Oligoflexales bacterium]